MKHPAYITDELQTSLGEGHVRKVCQDAIYAQADWNRRVSFDTAIRLFAAEGALMHAGTREVSIPKPLLDKAAAKLEGVKAERIFDLQAWKRDVYGKAVRNAMLKAEPEARISRAVVACDQVLRALDFLAAAERYALPVMVELWNAITEVFMLLREGTSYLIHAHTRLLATQGAIPLDMRETEALAPLMLFCDIILKDWRRWEAIRLVLKKERELHV